METQKALLLLDVARQLARSAEGLTIDEIAAYAEVSRRTADRLRQAVEMMFPQLETIQEGHGRRFRIIGGLDSFFQAPDIDELAELSLATKALETGGHGTRAATLRRLQAKVESAISQSAMRRLGPDVSALNDAQATILQAGPQPIVEPSVMIPLREAIKAMKWCGFKYVGSQERETDKTVIPYGILYGRTVYLVASENRREEPALYRFDRMSQVEVLAKSATRPAKFDLQEFARRSFGTFQEKPEDVVLRFDSRAAREASQFRFHPTQSLKPQKDGSLIVRFRAGGLLELAQHLFTWRDCVEIVKPARLRRMMTEELELALSQHKHRRRKKS